MIYVYLFVIIAGLCSMPIVVKVIGGYIKGMPND